MTRTTPWAALAAPFQPHEVKTRRQGGRELSYVTARTVMNRLDTVLGPEAWWDEYVPMESSVVCRLSILLPDGRVLTKTDAGGMAGMSDAGDDDKSGFSDAFKRAAVKFGVGRYLYCDGVPAYASVVASNGHTAPEALPEKAPRNGGWLYRMADKRGALDWFNGFGRDRGFPRKIVDWSDGQVRIALDAKKKANGLPR